MSVVVLPPPTMENNPPRSFSASPTTSPISAASPPPRTSTTSPSSWFKVPSFSDLLAGSYQYIPGVKEATCAIAAKTVEQLAPKPGVFKEKIAATKKRLFESTGSHVLSETCRTLALFSKDFLLHQLKAGSQLDAGMRSPFIDDLLWDKNSTSSTYGIRGDLIKTSLETSPDLICEIIELNMLKAFEKIILYFQKAQKDNPFWLIDLVNESMKLYSDEIDGKNKKGTENTTENFLNTLCTAIIKIGLPHGETDLDIPLPGVGNYIFDKMRKSILPAIMGIAYENSTTDYARDYMTLSLFTMGKKFLSGNLKLAEDTNPAAPIAYPKKQEFLKNFEAIARKTLSHLDPSLYSTLDKYSYAETWLKALGETTLNQLGRLDFNWLCNFTSELVLPIMNEGGYWEGKNEALHFVDKPNYFYTKDKDYNDFLEIKKKKQADIRKETASCIASLHQDISGLSEIVSKSLISVPEGKAWDKKIAESSLLEFCELLLKSFCQKLVSFFSTVAGYFFGSYFLETPSAKFFEKSKSVPLAGLLKPFESMIVDKIAQRVL